MNDTTAFQPKGSFRDYDNARDPVKTFYRDNHRYQTLEFARAKRAEYARLDKGRMGVWEALELLETLVDDSDPDTELTQIEHSLQTAEAMRDEGQPRWFVLTGLVHDLGKILVSFGEPQWAVTGDTFALGCAFPKEIVYHEYLDANPDSRVSEYQSEVGIYEEGAGFDNVTLSFGHDEYMYYVARPYLPQEALYTIRYHSFYTAFAHEKLMSEADRELLPWMRQFHEYDLYSKADAPPDVAALKPYYQELIAEFFPPKIDW